MVASDVMVVIIIYHMSFLLLGWGVTWDGDEDTVWDDNDDMVVLLV